MKAVAIGRIWQIHFENKGHLEFEFTSLPLDCVALLELYVKPEFRGKEKGSIAHTLLDAFFNEIRTNFPAIRYVQGYVQPYEIIKDNSAIKKNDLVQKFGKGTVEYTHAKAFWERNGFMVHEDPVAEYDDMIYDLADTSNTRSFAKGISG